MFQTIVLENIKTHIFSIIFSGSLAVCEIMWENMAHSDRPQMIL